MKRDFDLIRKILNEVESSDHGYYVGYPEIKGYSVEQIRYHIHLLGESGLADVVDVSFSDGNSPQAELRNLTWQGHDFLDSIKDESLWEKAKKTVLGSASGIAIDVLMAWAKNEAMKKLGLVSIPTNS